MWFRKKKPTKNVVLILTRHLDDSLVRVYRSILTDLPVGFEAKILLHDEDNTQSGGILGLIDQDLIQFNYAALYSLNIPLLRGTIVPGNTHFPLYYYFENHDDQFDYYWLIESDVRFSGKWIDFLGYFENKRQDLVCAHLATPATNPKWYWWEFRRPNGEILPMKKCIRAFLPVIRLSNRAIRTLINAQREGYTGHAEVLIPTLLKRAGMKLMDMGGKGEFTKQAEVNRFYIGANVHRKGILNEGSFRYRPSLDSWGEKSDTLYHPVKD